MHTTSSLTIVDHQGKSIQLKLISVTINHYQEKSDRNSGKINLKELRLVKILRCTVAQTERVRLWIRHVFPFLLKVQDLAVIHDLARGRL